MENATCTRLSLRVSESLQFGHVWAHVENEKSLSSRPTSRPSFNSATCGPTWRTRHPWRSPGGHNGSFNSATCGPTWRTKHGYRVSHARNGPSIRPRVGPRGEPRLGD